MKKLMNLMDSPWPMLGLTALALVVAILTSLDWAASMGSPADESASPEELHP
jgi:hypothetical protein